MKKTKKNVLDNPRAMAKLLKEAGRVKNILSANIDIYAQIENLIDEQDFRLQVPNLSELGLGLDCFIQISSCLLSLFTSV